MITKPYALIDTDSGETIRYLDKRTAPPAGCKVIRTGYKPLTPYQKARRVADALQDQSFPF